MILLIVGVELMVLTDFLCKPLNIYRTRKRSDCQPEHSPRSKFLSKFSVQNNQFYEP